MTNMRLLSRKMLSAITIAQDGEPKKNALRDKIDGIADRFRKLRWQYCDEFGLTHDEFKAKFQQGKSYKDFPLDELEKMSENLLTSLKTNTP